MAQAAGKRRSKIPPLPSGFIYDLPSLTRPPHSASASPVNPSPSNAAATPRVSPSVQTPPGNSAELQLLNLQIEKQQLELRLLELEAQSRARDLVSTTTTKPQTVPSLDAVSSGSNNGKSQGQLDHNTRITNPQLNGLTCTFRSAFHGRNSKTSPRQNLFTVISIFIPPHHQKISL